MNFGVCGGDWNLIKRTMTIPRLRLLQEAWRVCPPPAQLLAWAHRYKPPKKEDKMTMQRFVELMKLRGGHLKG